MDASIVDAIENGTLLFVEKPLFLHEKKRAVLLNVHNPSFFSVQFIDEKDLEYKMRLEEALEMFAETSVTKYKPKKVHNGMPVMVPNLIEPGMYCRAHLILTDENLGPQVAVDCVDLGYSFMVDSDSLRMVTMELLRIPKLAYYCKLYKMESLKETWPEMDWKPYFSGKETILSIKNQNEGIYEVQMAVDSKDVTDSLVNEFMLAKMTPLEIIRNNSGPYPIYDFSNWLHLKVPVFGLTSITGEKALFQLNVDIANFLIDATESYIACLTEELRNETFVMDIGVPCLALYKEDGLWYRAQIMEIKESKTFKVLFVDFGNTELVNDTELIRLPQHLLNVPVAATEVVIADVLGIKSKEEVEKLKGLIESKDLIAQIDNPQLHLGGKDRVVISVWLEDGTSLSDIFEAYKKDVVQTVISAPELCDQTFSELMVGDLSEYFPGNEYTGIVSFIESVKSVWLQLNDGDVEAEKISYEVDQYYSQSDLMLSLEFLKKGFYCAAKQPSDSRWYRAIISAINPSEKLVTVVFIDYGNDETVPVECVKPLITYFALHKSFSLQVALEVEEKPDVDPEECVNAILDFTDNRRVIVNLYHKDNFNYACIKINLVDILFEKNLINKLTI